VGREEKVMPRSFAWMLLVGIAILAAPGPRSYAEDRPRVPAPTRPVPKPGPRSQPDSIAGTLVGTYVSNESTGDIHIKSLGNGGIWVESVGRFSSLGFFDGVEYWGITRLPRGSSGRGMLRFRVDVGIIEAELFDSLAAKSGRRELWSRASAGPQTNQTNEYVYAEELPEAIEKPPAEYPPGVAIDGTVLVQALVGTDGLVKEVKVIKSVPELDAAAVAAVKRWRFKPATTNGKPLAVWVAVPVRFSRP
jgi:TonB family protein